MGYSYTIWLIDWGTFKVLHCCLLIRVSSRRSGSSTNQKVGSLIPVPKCPGAKYWTPDCPWCVCQQCVSDEWWWECTQMHSMNVCVSGWIIKLYSKELRVVITTRNEYSSNNTDCSTIYNKWDLCSYIKLMVWDDGDIYRIIFTITP